MTLKEVRFSPESKALELEIEPQGDARYTTRFVGTLKGYDPARKPVKDKDGKPLPVTQRYSDDVGKVLATVEGTRATYRLTGEELYVRAVVTSDRPPENPSFPDQKAQAWTQPVGWEGRIGRVRGRCRGHGPSEGPQAGHARPRHGGGDPRRLPGPALSLRVRPKDYKPNTTGDSYFRFIDVETGEATPAFAHGYDLGCAYAEGGLDVGLRRGSLGRTKVVAFRSEDLKTWEEHPALDLPGWGLFNTSVCKAGDRYVMAIEVGKPPEVVGVPFTTRFAESTDLKDWTLLPEDRVFTKERYSACPSIRHLDGMYYMTYLEARPGPRYETHIVRSR